MTETLCYTGIALFACWYYPIEDVRKFLGMSTYNLACHVCRHKMDVWINPLEALKGDSRLLSYIDKGEGRCKVLVNGNSVWFPGVDRCPGTCPVPTVDALRNNMVMLFPLPPSKLALKDLVNPYGGNKFINYTYTT